MVILSRVRSKQLKAWVEAEVLQQVNLVIIRDPQSHLPNPYDVEEEGESGDKYFQDVKVINEEPNHDEDPSQGFGIWDATPIHEEDLSNEDEDSKERPLLPDLVGEYEEDGFPPIFGGL